MIHERNEKEAILDENHHLRKHVNELRLKLAVHDRNSDEHGQNLRGSPSPGASLSEASTASTEDAASSEIFCRVGSLRLESGELRPLTSVSSLNFDHSLSSRDESSISLVDDQTSLSEDVVRYVNSASDNSLEEIPLHHTHPMEVADSPEGEKLVFDTKISSRTGEQFIPEGMSSSTEVHSQKQHRQHLLRSYSRKECCTVTPRARKRGAMQGMVARNVDPLSSGPPLHSVQNRDVAVCAPVSVVKNSCKAPSGFLHQPLNMGKVAIIQPLLTRVGLQPVCWLPCRNAQRRSGPMMSPSLPSVEAAKSFIMLPPVPTPRAMVSPAPCYVQYFGQVAH